MAKQVRATAHSPKENRLLAAMPEGDETVLDHSCLVFLSNMWSGSAHDSSKLPLVTVGVAGFLPEVIDRV